MAPKSMAKRFQWSSPIELSPHAPATLYHGANQLYRSRDRGEHWEIISPDLTRNDKSKQEWSGGPITGDNTGVEIYGTIFSIDESPLTRGEIYVGSDDGRIHVSINDGGSWTDITPHDLPVDATVEFLRASRHVAGRAYAVAHRYRLGDDLPYVYVSDDRGEHWRSLRSNLPAVMPLYALVEDERDAGTLYLGAETELYASLDGGRHWSSIQGNLPHVAVVDLETAQGDLIIGTRGRGLWVMHDLAPLKWQLQHPTGRQPWLAQPRDAIRWRGEFNWAKDDGAKNPDYGAPISYYLPTELDSGFELVLEIADESGKRVRRLSSVPKPPSAPVGDPDGPSEAPAAELTKKQGWNVATWDLRHDGAESLKDAKIDAGDPSVGPLAIPGSYALKLKLPDETLDSTVRVVADPRSPADTAAMAANLAFALQMRAALERARRGIELLRAARTQAKDLAERLKDTPGSEAVIAATTQVIADADRIEGQLHNPEAKVVYDILRGPKGAQLYSQLAPLYTWAQDSDLAPTAAMQERYADLAAQLSEREAAIAAMREGSIRELEEAVAAAKLPRVILPGAN
jgi:hypothetical protein